METPSHLPEVSWSAHSEIELTLPVHLLVYPLSPGLSPKWRTSFLFEGLPQRSSLHTIAASFKVQWLSQIFPHWSLCKTSSLPEQRSVPLMSLVDAGKEAEDGIRLYCRCCTFRLVCVVLTKALRLFELALNLAKIIMLDVRATEWITWAYNTSIFTVVTVMVPETFVRAFGEGLLVTDTLDVVQPNLILASAEEGLVVDRQSGPAVHLSACDGCFRHPPFVIANRPPLSLVEDLHSAGALIRPVYQPNRLTVWQVEK